MLKRGKGRFGDMPTSKREMRKIKGGYFWKILWIDLNRKEAKVLEFDEAFALKYIGGRGFGANWSGIISRKESSILWAQKIFWSSPQVLSAVSTYPHLERPLLCRSPRRQGFTAIRAWVALLVQSSGRPA
jgi:hypothetical protein